MRSHKNINVGFNVTVSLCFNGVDNIRDFNKKKYQMVKRSINFNELICVAIYVFKSIRKRKRQIKIFLKTIL